MGLLLLVDSDVSLYHPNGLHKCTPRHVHSAYEKGRWSREHGFRLQDCPYQWRTDIYQEWCIGWFDEDQERLVQDNVGEFGEW